MLVSLHEAKFINQKSFFRYVTCKVKKEAQQTLYNRYVANCLKGITSNTAKLGGGSVVDKTLAETTKKIDDIDIFGTKKERPRKVTAEQIVSNIVAKGGLKFKTKRKEETK